ncbi:IclR family transcriptional regulator [Pigmentiphaga sp. NML080357]|uniref:IclR family transcriptional regulator n=1 Tax=Pigmentiphaga sp. NML080357 TaxID=2008675 RepID=UPI000B40AD3F|nr:IclR family transcriptional regulator [Pigmentiphaga sp. NML080357]OVZ56318.1 IclR family transcriptional regulator [Pigmentiphaga sp. NML080357]
MKPLSSSDAAQEKYVVPGLERGLRVLCEVGKGDGTVTAPDLARRLGVPRTTVFRLLATLERLGFVQRAENGRDYSLGMAVLRLGFEYLASLELTQLGAPLLERVRNEFNLSCHLVVRDGPDIVYVAKAAANTPLASSVNVGTRLPAHATVLGRVLMAEMALDELRALYPDGTLAAVNSFTPRSVEELHALLQRDRRRPYLLHEGFFESGISTLAAPVRTQGGAIVAALGVAMPAVPLEDSRLERLARSVCDSAAELSSLLNYRGQDDAYGFDKKLNGMVA